VSPREVPHLISAVYDALSRLGSTEPEPERREPAVPIRRSVKPDAIICLEDGLSFKSLKRHLMTHHDLTPEAYRAKWALPTDYPMVSPNYSATRSELARASSLGRGSAPTPRRR
jgi:predicted transcriptional regulator